MAIETFPFDPAELLDSPEAQAAFLSDIMADGDAAAVAEGIQTVARACGIEAGLSRETLYRTLSELSTISKVLGAMGLRLAVVPAANEEGRPA